MEADLLPGDNIYYSSLSLFYDSVILALEQPGRRVIGVGKLRRLVYGHSLVESLPEPHMCIAYARERLKSLPAD